MKCALDFVTERTQALIKAEEEERQRVEKIKANFQAMKENAIYFCENQINEDLGKAAADVYSWKQKNSIRVEYNIRVQTDGLNNRYFQLITKDKIKYADGTPSETASGYKYALDKLIEHLKAYCIDTRLVEYHYKSYGSGDLSGHTLIVEIPVK